MTTYISLIVLLVLAVIYIIAMWKVFEKANIAGWKSIIPAYNQYNVFKLCWNTTYFWIWLVAIIASSVLSNIDNTVALVIALIAVIVASVISIIQSHKLSKAFGYGIIMTLVLIFFNFIGALILGFGSAKYQGPQE